jgi:hypothetical protein
MRTRTAGVTVVAVLALMQGIVGVLVGMGLLQLASIFEQRGGPLSLLIVMLAEVKGWLWITLSLMYVLFAAGAWQVRSWAWWVGLLVSVLTLLYGTSILLKGVNAAVVAGLIVPVVIFAYVLSPAGRQAFGQASGARRPAGI